MQAIRTAANVRPILIKVIWFTLRIDFSLLLAGSSCRDSSPLSRRITDDGNTLLGLAEDLSSFVPVILGTVRPFEHWQNCQFVWNPRCGHERDILFAVHLRCCPFPR